MRPSSPSSDDALLDDERGSAALEFIIVGVLLLVPIVYLVVALGMIQQQALGAEAAARHVARAVATASDTRQAGARAERVIASVVHDYGMSADDVRVEYSCATPGACPQAGATLVVTIHTTVRLPLVPPVLGLDRATAIPVEATAAQKVSRLWGVP